MPPHRMKWLIESKHQGEHHHCGNCGNRHDFTSHQHDMKMTSLHCILILQPLKTATNCSL